MFVFWYSVFWVAIAEMGDKSQLVALAFATRFSAWLVLSAIFAATLLVHLGSVVLGEMTSAALPERWVTLAAGAAFIGFGLWTIRGDTLDDGEGGGSAAH